MRILRMAHFLLSGKKPNIQPRIIFKRSKFLLRKISTVLLINGEENLKGQPLLFLIFEPNDLSNVQIYRNINQAISTINKYMKRIAENLKLDRVPTTNFARHSFSTVLKRAGVSIEMISEQL